MKSKRRWRKGNSGSSDFPLKINRNLWFAAKKPRNRGGLGFIILLILLLLLSSSHPLVAFPPFSLIDPYVLLLAFFLNVFVLLFSYGLPLHFLHPFSLPFPCFFSSIFSFSLCMFLQFSSSPSNFSRFVFLLHLSSTSLCFSGKGGGVSKTVLQRQFGSVSKPLLSAPNPDDKLPL